MPSGYVIPVISAPPPTGIPAAQAVAPPTVPVLPALFGRLPMLLIFLVLLIFGRALVLVLVPVLVPVFVGLVFDPGLFKDGHRLLHGADWPVALANLSRAPWRGIFPPSGHPGGQDVVNTSPPANRCGWRPKSERRSGQSRERRPDAIKAK